MAWVHLRIHRHPCRQTGRGNKSIRLSTPSESKTRGLGARCLWNRRARTRVLMKGHCYRGVQGGMEALVECLTPRSTLLVITDRRSPNRTHQGRISSKVREISSNRHFSPNNLTFPWLALSTKISCISSSYKCRCSNSSNTSSSKPFYSSRCTNANSRGCRNINNSSTFSSNSKCWRSNRLLCSNSTKLNNNSNTIFNNNNNSSSNKFPW